MRPAALRGARLPVMRCPWRLVCAIRRWAARLWPPSQPHLGQASRQGSQPVQHAVRQPAHSQALPARREAVQPQGTLSGGPHTAVPASMSCAQGRVRACEAQVGSGFRVQGAPAAAEVGELLLREQCQLEQRRLRAVLLELRQHVLMEGHLRAHRPGQATASEEGCWCRACLRDSERLCTCS